MVSEVSTKDGLTASRPELFVEGVDVGGLCTAGVAPDGSHVIVRRYTGNSPQASIWMRPPGGSLWEAFSAERCDVPLHYEPQGEAIGFDPNDFSYYTLSENQSAGAQIPIWHFPEE